MFHWNTLYEPVQNGFLGYSRKPYLFWENWKKHLFSYKKTIIFVAVFEKTQIFEKNFFSQIFIFRLPKQSTFIHSLSIYPIFWTKTELKGDFYQKTCFLPFLPPISLYKSTHNKILAKRGKSVSLEFQYGAACKKLGNSDLQFSRSSVFSRFHYGRGFTNDRPGPQPLASKIIDAEARTTT